MNAQEAKTAVLAGKKVRKISWFCTQHVSLINNNFVLCDKFSFQKCDPFDCSWREYVEDPTIKVGDIFNYYNEPSIEGHNNEYASKYRVVYVDEQSILSIPSKLPGNPLFILKDNYKRDFEKHITWIK